jgi:hypothetical protein
VSSLAAKHAKTAFSGHRAEAISSAYRTELHQHGVPKEPLRRGSRSPYVRAHTAGAGAADEGLKVSASTVIPEAR